MMYSLKQSWLKLYEAGEDSGEGDEDGVEAEAHSGDSTVETEWGSGAQVGAESRGVSTALDGASFEGSGAEPSASPVICGHQTI